MITLHFHASLSCRLVMYLIKSTKVTSKYVHERGASWSHGEFVLTWKIKLRSRKDHFSSFGHVQNFLSRFVSLPRELTYNCILVVRLWSGNYFHFEVLLGIYLVLMYQWLDFVYVRHNPLQIWYEVVFLPSWKQNWKLCQAQSTVLA